MSGIKIVQRSVRHKIPDGSEVGPMSKQARMLNHPDIREYMECYNAYLSGGARVNASEVEQLHSVEDKLKQSGHSKEILALAREHVKQKRLQGQRGRNGATA